MKLERASWTSTPARRVLVTAFAGAAATAIVTVVAGPEAAFRNLELHVAVVTAEALIALLCAFLVLGRFAERARLDDLALTAALGVLALVNLGFAAVPAVAAQDQSAFASRAALLGRLLGGLLLAVAAFAPTRGVRRPRRMLLLVGVSVALALAGIALVTVLAKLGQPASYEVRPPGTSGPGQGHADRLLAEQVVRFLSFVFAAAGFALRANRTDDRLLGWLAVAAVLAGVARINYFIYPSEFSSYVHSGDVFRLLFYVVVLVAAASEMRGRWRAAAAAATLEERARIARELHDGLAQELASVRRNLCWLDHDEPLVARAISSADRALIASREAITTLNEGSCESLEVALAAAARAVGDREGAHVVMHVPPGSRVPPRVQHALVMIASEAITNAARHSGSDTVRIDVSTGDRLRVRIRDDGAGFEPDCAAALEGHYGLASMRQRAETVGAEFQVRSRRGYGTELEVTL